MTYRELANKILLEWSAEQQDSDLTIVDLVTNEAYPAELSFVEPDETGETDDFGLDDNHPFLYIGE